MFKEFAWSIWTVGIGLVTVGCSILTVVEERVFWGRMKHFKLYLESIFFLSNKIASIFFKYIIYSIYSYILLNIDVNIYMYIYHLIALHVIWKNESLYEKKRKNITWKTDGNHQKCVSQSIFQLIHFLN